MIRTGTPTNPASPSAGLAFYTRQPHAPHSLARADASALMAPPLDPDKAAALMKNPWAPRLIEKDIELLKMQKRKKEEEE